MAIDQTARESNLRDSVKKHFVDNINRTEGIALTFDKKLSTPDLQDKSIDRWISVNLGPIIPLNLSSVDLIIYLCSRKDPEGMKLAKLRDTLLNYLTDTSTSDGMKRIKMYRIPPRQSPIEVSDTTLLVTGINEGSQMEAPDGTNYKIVTVTLKWMARI